MADQSTNPPLCVYHARALISVRWEADMTPRFPINASTTWLSLVGNAVPPRDPNDDDDDEDEEDEDEDEDREPAVIREPDEDE